jgi:DNA-binding NarL/FixJ family response regulator
VGHELAWMTGEYSGASPFGQIQMCVLVSRWLTSGSDSRSLPADRGRESARDSPSDRPGHPVARGRKGGRPSVMAADHLDIARTLRKSGKSYREIGSVLKVGASTVREHLAKAG